MQILNPLFYFFVERINPCFTGFPTFRIFPFIPHN
nr:MAG TPA: hypothetical protein [Caudoviricetes sp.]